VLVDGVVAGFLASLVVALAFLVWDAAHGAPLHTPTVLGTRLFRGLEAAQAVQVDVPIAIAYNALHFAGFALGGLLCSWVAALVERAPKTWYLGLVAVSFVLAAILYADAALDVTGLGRLHLFAAAILGISTMGAFLWWRHPGIRAHLGDVWQD
jgi:hypothetical protein